MKQTGPSNAAWRPSLQEVNDPNALLRTIQTLAERIDSLHQTSYQGDNQTKAVGAAVARLTPDEINSWLSAHGAAPLNLTALLGRAYTPQLAWVPEFSAVPNENDPVNQQGVLISVNGALYNFNDAFPGSFIQTGALGVALSDTHANRLANYDPDDYPIGVLFYETNRTVLYINTGTFGSSTWNYVTGIMSGLLSARPTDLVSTDVGFLFYASNQFIVYRWTGSAWVVFIPSTMVINAAGPDGTVGPGGTLLPPGIPTVAALPLVSDPLSVIGQYIIYNGVPWVFVAPLSGAGDGFWEQAGGAAQTISDTRAARSGYAASSYPQGTAYFETDTLLTYVVQIPQPSGVKTWVYYDGRWDDVHANLPSLGINDRWLTFYATDYIQGWVWNGTAWNFRPGSSSGYLLMVFPGITTLPPGLWGACDGSTYDVTQNDATLVSVTPAVAGNTYIRR